MSEPNWQDLQMTGTGIESGQLQHINKAEEATIFSANLGERG
jgi:hypothetical protein